MSMGSTCWRREITNQDLEMNFSSQFTSGDLSGRPAKNSWICRHNQRVFQFDKNKICCIFFRKDIIRLSS
jgi:hypothetical protein